MGLFQCFGVPIEGMSLNETVARIASGRARWVVTANPEILLEARRDKTYRDILRQADVRIADGVGLVAVARLMGHRLHRVTGVELAEKILDESVKQNWTVAFIGGGNGVAMRALEEQKKRHPSLKGLAFDGGRISPDGTSDAVGDEAIQQLTMSAPDVLLVAFGHPKQERWIARNIEGLPSVKIAIGVGGTFDYWAGTAKRAPVWMRSFGLEWLFRLIVEPKRWKRIWRAVVVFPLTCLFAR